MTGQSYNTGKDSGSSYRVERRELKELLRLLTTGNSVLLTGGRKIGKTVLLEQAGERLLKDTASVTIPLYYDLMVMTRPVTARPFFDALSRKVAPEVNRFLKRLNVPGTCPPAPSNWKYDPSLEFTYYITEVLDYLDDTVGRTTFIYMLDECEQLLDSPETNNLMGNLRALVGPTMGNRVRLVVAGFRDIKEYKDPKTRASPFKNLLRPLSLGLLQKDEFDELATPLLDTLPGEYREQVRSRLWVMTGGHPCVIQTVCDLFGQGGSPESFDAVCEHATELLQDMAFNSWVERFNPEDHELFRRILKGKAARREKRVSVEFLRYCGVLAPDADRLQAPCELFNAWYREYHSTEAHSSSLGHPDGLAVESESEPQRGPAATVTANSLTEKSMSSDFNFKEIQEALVRRYNIDELHDLCSALRVPFEDLGATTLSGKAREMIYWLHRRRRLEELEPHLEGTKIIYREQAVKLPAAASQPGSGTHDSTRRDTADEPRSTDTPSDIQRKGDTNTRPQVEAGEGRGGGETSGPLWARLVVTIMLGVALLAFFVWVFLYAPDSLPVYKQRILAIFSALLCGLFAFFLTGTFGLSSKALRTPLGDISLKATSGMAIFVLVLIWWLSPLTPVPAKENLGEKRTTETSKGSIILNPFAPWRVPGAVNSITLDASEEGGAIAVETGVVHVWQTRPDREPLKLPNTGEPQPVRSVSLGTNRELIALGSADGTVRLYRTGGAAPPEVVRSHTSQVFEVYLSRDGRQLVTTGEDKGGVRSARLWGISSRMKLDRTLRTPNFDDEILAVSPDLQLVAIYSQRNRRIELWSIADGRLVIGLKDSDTAVSGGGAFSEDAKLFAAGSADGAVRLWRSADGERLKNLNGPSQRVMSVAVHPAGQTVAAGYADGTLYIWSVEDESVQKQIKVHEQRVNTLAFSRNGRVLGSGGEDGMVQLFEVTVKT